MHMLYNSPSYIVVQFDVPLPHNLTDTIDPAMALRREGFEIVDKFTRKEIFIEGALAQQFQEGVESLIDLGPDVEDLEDFIGLYAQLGQQPVVMH
ncbi:DUF3567 domain-containing protein [Roseateles sp. BYS180W]|uniref:DUF3567 domain-containing protein n=1 Tax=Roseateles rivi TaxID=3299028 RepID=A0ABW7FQR3_9BURK